jgi:DNA adenine methylase
MSALKAPFPWFGGKSRVAADVWARFGDTPNFVEPFAGSMAVLLGRPAKHAAKIETVNDLDGFIANFWRAVQFDPEATADWADWPVNESDLTARHSWLVGQRDSLVRRLEGDPLFFDPQIAGWWVAGVCGWIGSGFCSGEGPWYSVGGELVNVRQMPHLTNAGQGVNRQMPHVGNAGRGVNRQMPHVGNAGRGVNLWFADLSDRLRNVRVLSGDWERALSESITVRHGMTAVFLDPPYGDEVEQTRVYASDSGTVSDDVRVWCIENGNNALLRIALCGYEGEGHEELLDYGWTSHAWKTAGGYGGGRGGVGDANRHKERIYFSPACLGEDVSQQAFDFEGMSA